ncbi:syndecan-2-like [Betta splendens]|uniref:Syndecan n=1 Tax=Betta splendens TaxID=158456 RepID=A0A6P7KSL1_BETSP|nr:syndecan-2-like [Betta splendens]
MRKLGLLFLVGLASAFISEKLLVSAQTSYLTDDLYLEGRPSGDLPVDDEDDQDGGSGSGSGDYYPTDQEVLRKVNKEFETTSSKERNPTDTTPTTAAESHDQTTTMEPPPYIPDGKDKEQEVLVTKFPDNTRPSTTKMPSSETTQDYIFDNNQDEEIIKVLQNDVVEKSDSRGNKLHVQNSPELVTSENIWERTDVLAAVIACGVVGFLCAVFLLLLLAYRMKKKDEGSYDLGDTKLSTTAYHKAPTKEFYA